jgi:hypothetical protein
VDVKPHEEEWMAVAEPGALATELVLDGGDVIARFEIEDEASAERTRFAARAPEMARAMLALLEMYNSKWPSPQQLEHCILEHQRVLAEAGVVASHLPKRDGLTIYDRSAVFDLALTDDVQIRDREVWARRATKFLKGGGVRGLAPHEMGDFKLVGLLAADLTVDDAEAEIAEAYGK